MSTTSSAPTRPAPAPRGGAAGDPARLFYAAAAALLVVLAFVGFQQFYLHGRAYPGRDIAPPIRSLVVAHGVGMTLWMLLLVVQPLLIVGRRHRVHMTLGWVGTALAAAIVVVGWQTGVGSASVTPPEARIWGLPARQFMIVPLGSVVLFAAFVAAGVLARRRRDLHRPMMLLATLAAMSAAISRIDALNALYVGTACETLFGPFFTTLVLAVVLVAVKSALSRTLDRPFAIGCALLVVADAVMWQSATSSAWDALAARILA